MNNSLQHHVSAFPQDAQFMREALLLAEKGRFNVSPNPLVGCVIVQGSEIIARGWHEQVGQAHAEVNAIKNATQSIVGATVYVTLEPCSHHGRTPPCANALIAAGVKRVVIACLDDNPLVRGQGVNLLDAAGIETTVGVLQEQARFINRGFFKRMQSNRPWVVAKIAASLDGKTALSNGASKWITSEQARADVQKLRGASDAIITGIGTVLADDPQLTVRIDGKNKAPLKVVLDRQLRTPIDAKIVSTGQVLLVHDCVANARQSNYAENSHVSCAQIDSLSALLDYLGEKQMNYVMIEAGATLSGAFIQSALVDELVVYLAPDMLGASAREMVDIAAITDLSDKCQFEFHSVQKVGRDLRLTLLPTTHENV